MIRTLSVFAFYFLLSHTLAHANDWTGTDTAFQVTYSIVHILDWGQTLDIENRPGIIETNPILGEHPSRSDINIYMASTLIGHAVVSYALPQGWRRAWQAAGIGLELAMLGNNYRLGLRMGF